MKKVLIAAVVVVFCLSLTGAFVFAKPQSRNVKKDKQKIEKSDKTAWLGVMTQTVDEDIADAFEIDIDYGAIINEVIDDSPAEKADLEEGDVIISFNGQKVWDQHDLTDFILESGVGSKANIGIMRDGREKNVSLELGSLPSRVNWSSRKHDAPHSFGYVGPDDVQFFHFSGGGYIGVELSELSDQLGEFFGVSGGDGVLITGVSEDSPAKKAGLQAGDVIVEIDNKHVSDYNDIREIVSGSDEGDELAVVILRSKKKQTVEVTVEESEGNNFNFGYNFQVPPVPNVPDIDVRVPRVKGNFNRDGNAYFDYDNYKEEMEKFKADMKLYKDDMKALSRDMNRMKGDRKDELEQQIKELNERIRELERKIQ